MPLLLLESLIRLEFWIPERHSEVGSDAPQIPHTRGDKKDLIITRSQRHLWQVNASITTGPPAGILTHEYFENDEEPIWKHS